MFKDRGQYGLPRTATVRHVLYQPEACKAGIIIDQPCTPATLMMTGAREAMR